MGKLRDQMLDRPSVVRSQAKDAGELPAEKRRTWQNTLTGHRLNLGEAELKEYLLYLIKERHLSEGTFRFYVAGLKFLYRTTLKREWPVEKIKHPRSQEQTPGRSGSLGGGIPLFGHQEPQAQGDADDHVFIGIESK